MMLLGLRLIEGMNGSGPACEPSFRSLPSMNIKI